MTPEREAVLVKIMGEGGTVYRSQLSADERVQAAMLMGTGHVADHGNRVKLTAAGRRAAMDARERR